MSFEDKVAIVTGGGSGLGEAIGKELAAKGAKVVLSDINAEAAERVASEISGSGGTASAIEQDTARKEDSEKVVRYGPQGLRINSVGPGYIMTPLLENNLSPEILQLLVTRHPLGRLGRAEEVSHVVCFLLSEEASFMTGGYYLVDGGYTAV